MPSSPLKAQLLFCLKRVLANSPSTPDLVDSSFGLEDKSVVLFWFFVAVIYIEFVYHAQGQVFEKLMQSVGTDGEESGKYWPRSVVGARQRPRITLSAADPPSKETIQEHTGRTQH